MKTKRKRRRKNKACHYQLYKILCLCIVEEGISSYALTHLKSSRALSQFDTLESYGSFV